MRTLFDNLDMHSFTMITVKSFLDNLDNNEINDITKCGYDEDDYDQYFWDILKEHIIKKRMKEENIKETYKLLEQFLPSDIIKYHIKDYSLETDYKWRLHNLGLKIVKNVYTYNIISDYPPSLVDKNIDSVNLFNPSNLNYYEEITQINCKLVVLYLTKYGMVPYRRLWYYDCEEDVEINDEYFENQRACERQFYDAWDLALHSILDGKILCRMSVRDLTFRLEFDTNDFYDVKIYGVYRSKYPYVWFEIPSTKEEENEIRPFRIKLMEDDDVVFTSDKYYV